MKKIWISMLLALVLILGACSGDKEDAATSGSVDDGEAQNENGAIDHGVDENNIGFGLTDDTIEEAQNIPPAEKEEIMQMFETYIDAFNDKDIERFSNLLSENTESFDKEEERVYMEKNFKEFDFERTASNVTIVKYSEKEAQVFSDLETSMKQLSTGLETDSTGRQVTLLTKEDGQWKVASVHYIGDNK
ncbi:YybH family protein [Sporosarcina siberiensis]|uniref:YybH family protein n=1 Tax=Sporosarcina siberiensis TaxID=1365606 RepID=A0ABW4SBT6_9BACL